MEFLKYLKNVIHNTLNTSPQTMLYITQKITNEFCTLTYCDNKILLGRTFYLLLFCSIFSKKLLKIEKS